MYFQEGPLEAFAMDTKSRFPQPSRQEVMLTELKACSSGVRKDPQEGIKMG